MSESSWSSDEEWTTIAAMVRDTSSTDSNGSPNALKVTPRGNNTERNRTTPDTTKQLKHHSAIESDFSGSDDQTED